MINPKPKTPAPISTNIPQMSNVQKLPLFEKPPEKGIQQSYKNIANSSANVMWRAKVKGRDTLTDNIPLHMSLKTFSDPSQVPHEDIAQKVKELNIQRPDPAKIQYDATTHVSPRNGNTYYMLKLHGTDPSYDKFVDHFKGQGITYPNFMGHITIDKDLHDQIKREGIQPHEVEFSPLMIEHGANNPTHMFPDAQSDNDAGSSITPKKLNAVPSYDKTNVTNIKDHKKLAKSEFDHFYDYVCHTHFESLEKSTLKRLGTYAAVMGALAGAPAQAPAAPHNHGYNSSRMLNAISQVESSGGKNMNHEAVQGSMHHGEKAIGQYGMMPVTIRETLKLNPDLSRAHGKAIKLHGSQLEHYIQDNPGLENQIAQKHLQRLEHHFGNDPAKLGFAWLNGVTGTNKALKNHEDISKHWHVKKVNNAYNSKKNGV